VNSKVVPLRIPQYLYELAALNAQEQKTDKAAALRQWLHFGAIQYVLTLVAEGRISLERAADCFFWINISTSRLSFKQGPSQ
jgi:hypothetical protein